MTPDHPLDRPVWSALQGRQAHLALRRGDAVRLRPDMGIFAAAGTPLDLEDLTRLVTEHPGAGFLEAEDSPMAEVLPRGVAVARRVVLAQMTATAVTPGPTIPWEPLGDADAAEVAALAALTRPGPFRRRTHAFGGFIGVRASGRLVAMAGSRLRCEGFSEVSGVCTHPDHRGRGLASALMRETTGRIVAAGETAFLHAFADQPGTIALYRALGFEVRRRMVYTVLIDPGEAP